MAIVTGTPVASDWIFGDDNRAIDNRWSMDADGAVTAANNAVVASLMKLWEQNWGVAPTALVCAVYFALFTAARWYLIAVPTRRILAARMEELSADLLTAGDAPKANALLAAANKAFLEKSWLLWSGANELAAWRSVHSAQRALLSSWSIERVKLGLTTSQAELISLGDDGATALAAAIKDALAPTSSKSEAELRAMLERALDIIYENDDDQFADLSNWDNKTLWLTQCALVLVVVATASLGRPAYMLVGAIGGLMSRMSRVLKADKDLIPTDYGAYWTTLFLSPILGALAAWAGVLLIQAGVSLGVFGDVFKDLTWQPYDNHSAKTLGLCFVLGFSERYFENVLSGVYKKVGGEPDPAAPAPAAPAPAPPNEKDQKDTQP